MTKMVRMLVLGGLAAGLGLPAAAQTQMTPGTTPPSQVQRPAVGSGPTTAPARDDSVIVPAAELEFGTNRYTEAQARARMEEQGFTGITNLRRDDNGLWRARASRNSTSMDVAMDFRGRIAHGPGVANIAPRPGAAGGSTSSRTTPDGMPGNPPGTAAGRTMDRPTGTSTIGTSTIGTNPTGSNPTGTNPGPSR